MRWVRDVGWLVALVAVAVVVFTRPKPAKPPDPNETRAAFERLKAEYEAKKAAREAKLEKDLAEIRTDATLGLLRLLGREYREHLATAKAPPREADFADVLGELRSHRDDKPFTVRWGVDPAKLPDGGRGLLFAWEQTADKAGSRCVLMADGKTARVMSAEEFEKTPRAEPTAK